MYEGISDFKRKNEDCCKVLPKSDDVDAPPISAVERMLGYGNSFVKIKFKIFYRDESGDEHQQQNQVTYAISNCGIVSNY